MSLNKPQLLPKPGSKEFKDLQDVWYKKLKNSGFEDIEENEDRLKQWSHRFLKPGSPNTNPGDFYSKQEYFYLATRFLNEYKFKNEKQRIIWEYHSNGLSSREISKILSKIGLSGNFQRVSVIVNTLSTKMKEMYTK